MVGHQCRLRWSAALLALALTVAGCATGARTSLRITVGGAESLFDEPLRVTVSGAPPGGHVRVEAASTDGQHRRWTGYAEVVADRAGRVDLATAVPVNGSYTGAHDTGLLWLLGGGPDFYAIQANAITVSLTASQPDRASATATVTRHLRAAGVTATPLQMSDAGFVGTLFTPAGPSTPRPAVMAFGGSEGGIGTGTVVAQALASRGYPALALAYFDAPGYTPAGLPTALTDIPLEYFAGALRWLARQPDVDPKTINVYGLSRGSEAALLLGADFPELVHGVIATSPSSIVNGGLPDITGPSWTLHGQPLPHAPPSAWGVVNPLETDVIIPVEKIAGPVALLCGDDDRLWPSCQSVYAIAARLGDRRPLELLEPAAGHLVGMPVPNLPMPSGRANSPYGALDLGGTVQTDALGRLDAWPKLLAFLAAQHS